jgi:hypothetical protein
VCQWFDIWVVLTAFISIMIWKRYEVGRIWRILMQCLKITRKNLRKTMKAFRDFRLSPRC